MQMLNLHTREAPEPMSQIGGPPPHAVLVDAHGLGFSAVPGGPRLLDGVSFELSPGAISVVMGPNGAGKSMLLRLLAGLLPPDEGHFACRVRAHGAPERAARTALVMQKPVLLRRSAGANLDHAVKVAAKGSGISRHDRRNRVDELLRLAGLEAIADRPARLMSGGEQQRLSFVRALAGRPDVLLLDEPTANLDPHSTAAIESLTCKAAATGVKVVLVTHDITQARRLGEEVLFMHGGRVMECTPAERFFERPRQPEARAYLNGELLI